MLGRKELISLDESEEEDEIEAQPGGSAAFVGKNYISPHGLMRLKQELRVLKFEERPAVTRTVSWAAENGDRSENADYTYGKKRLREIDRRIRFLSKRIESAEVIDPLSIKSSKIQFGATVTVMNEKSEERTYTIVGVDEIDLQQGRISWLSPLAAALIKAEIGDVVIFRAPGGRQELEILGVVYKEIL